MNTKLLGRNLYVHAFTLCCVLFWLAFSVSFMGTWGTSSIIPTLLPPSLWSSIKFGVITLVYFLLVDEAVNGDDSILKYQ